jgi:hypothetical protein
LHIRAILLAATLAQPPGATKVWGVVQQLQQNQSRPQGTLSKKITFEFAETEVNEYFAYRLKTLPRPGLESVRVKFFPGNYVSTFSVLDFDAVEKWKPGTIPGVLKPLLSGKQAVWIDVRFHVEGAMATFTVEKAYYQNLRIPAPVVEKLMQVVAARQPEKIDTSKPVPLPMGLKNVWTAPQKAGGNT